MHILIAEDDALSRLLLHKAVERLGHSCEVARDGQEAWDAFEHGTYDVVISDWMMPELDGIELCRRIRAEEDAGYTYFVLLTANDDRNDNALPCPSKRAWEKRGGAIYAFGGGSCTACGRSFSLLSRRHHCRAPPPLCAACRARAPRESPWPGSAHCPRPCRS